MNHVRQQELNNEFGVTITSNIGCYLGVPLIHDRCKSSDFQFIINRMMKRLNGWKSNFLLLASRVTLARLALVTIRSYVMQTMKILIGASTRLTKYVEISSRANMKIGLKSTWLAGSTFVSLKRRVIWASKLLGT